MKLFELDNTIVIKYNLFRGICQINDDSKADQQQGKDTGIWKPLQASAVVEFPPLYQYETSCYPMIWILHFKFYHNMILPDVYKAAEGFVNCLGGGLWNCDSICAL